MSAKLGDNLNADFMDAGGIKPKMDDDDDTPRLSVEALKALQEFYAESEEKEKNKELDENWVSYYF